MEQLSDTAERLINLIAIASGQEADSNSDVETISFRIKKLSEVLVQESDCKEEIKLASKCLQWYDDYQRIASMEHKSKEIV